MTLPGKHRHAPYAHHEQEDAPSSQPRSNRKVRLAFRRARGTGLNGFAHANSISTKAGRAFNRNFCIQLERPGGSSRRARVLMILSEALLAHGTVKFTSTYPFAFIVIACVLAFPLGGVSVIVKLAALPVYL